ncbi:hypothetical protein C8F04DRAFT_1263058 [Mycena alexandri]|uniref:Uncharacterized protein n=1 Tax=Mycena alexandri TaxID=1745969 RepID=A0AAD6X3X5_9AGAR|nr:hypothetical protein C8F04DRAFT_1263058 [Mycena alexandri]
MSRTKADTRMCMGTVFSIAMYKSLVSPGLPSVEVNDHQGVHPDTPWFPPPRSRGRHAPMAWMTQLGGQMLNLLNSTMGLPKVTLLRILMQSLKCNGCECCYSVEGYHDHRRRNPQTGEFVCTDVPDIASDSALTTSTPCSVVRGLHGTPELGSAEMFGRFFQLHGLTATTVI